MVFRPLIWAVDLKRRRWRKSRFGRFPYIPLAMVSSYFLSVFLGRETLEDHSQLLKKLINAGLGRLLAFRIYGGIGMSASSLHRESIDSLILGDFVLKTPYQFLESSL